MSPPAREPEQCDRAEQRAKAEGGGQRSQLLELQARWIVATWAGDVAPDPVSRPELTEALLFAPLLAPRYRLDGTGAMPEAAERFTRSAPRHRGLPSTPPTSRRCAASGSLTPPQVAAPR